jgi:hypothetical protein
MIPRLRGHCDHGLEPILIKCIGHLVTNLPTLLSFDLSIHTFCNTNITIIKTDVSAVSLAI